MLTLARLHPQRTVLMSSPDGIEGKTPEEILAEYRKAIGVIDSYAVAVSNMTINIYGKAEDFKEWYTDDFKKKFVNAKAHAQNWLNNVMSRLYEVPQSIIDYDGLYKMYADEIHAACERLCSGNNPALHKVVETDIKKLYDSVKGRVDVVNELEKAIDEYISLITEDTSFFRNTYDAARKFQGVQQKKLDDFQRDKEELEKEIKRLSDVITGTGIAGGIALTAAPFCFACGPVGIFIGVLVAAAAIASLITAIAESVICNQKEQELQKCILQMNDTTKTVESLKAFTDQLNNIIAAAKLAKSAARQIKDYWNELENQMNELLSGLNSADEDIKKSLYMAVIKEIEEADNEWNAIVERAELLAQINIDIKKEKIEIKTA